jgi:hypothetical protein
MLLISQEPPSTYKSIMKNRLGTNKQDRHYMNKHG